MNPLFSQVFMGWLACCLLEAACSSALFNSPVASGPWSAAPRLICQVAGDVIQEAITNSSSCSGPAGVGCSACDRHCVAEPFFPCRVRIRGEGFGVASELARVVSGWLPHHHLSYIVLERVSGLAFPRCEVSLAPNVQAHHVLADL